MNWDALGAIGEVLGAGAVIVTLAYLAIQVRHGKSMLEANHNLAVGQAYQFRAAITSDNFRAQLANHDLIAIRVKEARGEELTEVENGAKQVMFALGHFAYDNLYYQHSLGLVDAKTWSGMRSALKEQLRDEVFAKSVALPKPMYTKLLDELQKELVAEQL